MTDRTLWHLTLDTMHAARTARSEVADHVVDHTTDVRRGKLRLYEAWGVPELWVEVPGRGTRSRPADLVPGLTIRLLDAAGAYRISPVSRAFPGWRAKDVHEAMNESVPSARTHARLERLGRVLGVCDGTGPDDDPLLRSLREERWAEGLAEGRTEGRVETRMEMVRQILLSRGIPVSTEFRGRAAAFAESGEEVLVAAAFACHSERDFYARIARTEDP